MLPLLQTAEISSIGDALRTAFASALGLLFGAIPKIIAFLLILLIGWFIVGIFVKIVVRVLHAIHFNDMADRAGISGFVRNMGTQMDATQLLATLVKWFLRLIVLIVALDGLGVQSVTDVLQRLLLWLPDLFVALIIIVIGGMIANSVYRLARGSATSAGFSNANAVAMVAKVAVWAFVLIIAVNQIHVAASLVNILFMAVVGALALAFGLAFGLGGRDTAGIMVRDWHEQRQRMAEAGGNTPPPSATGPGDAPVTGGDASGSGDR